MKHTNYNYSARERLVRYVQIDTEADPNSETTPSSMKQKNLSKLLVEELQSIGIKDAEMDEWGYVYATIPATSNRENIPTICFCSHVDTAPDCSGKDVKPIVHENYQGKPLVLPDDSSQIITTEKHPYLASKIGDDIITASGKTLLGGDDKAGVAIIMDFAQFMMLNTQIPHGKIRILFTPDEEIGRGVDHVDMKKLGADYGYTLDGGPLGSIEDETFSADAMTFTFTGISAHPGYAKGKMVHAIKVAAHFVDLLPKDSWSPETTKNREGFVHPTSISGGLESATASFIIRDHQTAKLAEFENRLQELAEQAVNAFPGAQMEFKVVEQYRNMKEILETVPFVNEYAVLAIKQAGIEPKNMIIRGGTDGSRLSFMGLPCPNLFTGEMAIHSKHEFVSVQDMQKAVDTMIELVQIWEQH
ncbi:MAG: peptidase T [Bacteroidota bacterium]